MRMREPLSRAATEHGYVELACSAPRGRRIVGKDSHAPAGRGRRVGEGRAARLLPASTVDVTAGRATAPRDPYTPAHRPGGSEVVPGAVPAAGADRVRAQAAHAI